MMPKAARMSGRICSASTSARGARSRRRRFRRRRALSISRHQSTRPWSSRPSLTPETGTWYSVPSIWIPDAFFLRRDNLYPKLVLNRCGAISTDTMHRMKFRDGIDPELAIIAYYNSIAFAFTELCGRSYGGAVCLRFRPRKLAISMFSIPVY